MCPVVTFLLFDFRVSLLELKCCAVFTCAPARRPRLYREIGAFGAGAVERYLIKLFRRV